MISALRSLLGARSPDFPDHVSLPGGPLPLVVRVNTRARRMSLRVCAASRTVKLTLPPRVPHAQVRAFLDGHRGWIAAQAERRLLAPVPFAPGTTLPLGDGHIRLERGTGRLARREGDTLLVPGEGQLFAGRVRRWLAAASQRELDGETRALALTIGKDVREVRVGDFRSRWGSCAPDGRVAYSWRLILAPAHVREAVVAHEVAHMVEANHGPRFWKTATALLGRPHTEARSWLRANGPLLLSYGGVAEPSA